MTSRGGGGRYSSQSGNSHKEERVTFVADPSHPERFVPQVSMGGGGDVRRFEPEDLSRVLDFEGLASETPKDGGLMYGEDGGTDGLKFPVYHFSLRGGYLFYFSVEDVDEESGPFVVFHGPPVGVVPLEHVIVEFPPGGRRVFREHAHTDARNGYEMVILHVPDEEGDADGDNGGGGGREMRPPAFVVAESLGARERWAKALRERAAVAKPTLLRSGYVTSSKAAASSRKDEPAESGVLPSPATTAATAATTAGSSMAGTTATSSLLAGTGTPVASTAATAAAVAAAATEGSSKDKSRRSGTSTKRRESTSHGKQSSSSAAADQSGKALDGSREDAELASAIVEFGSANFNEKEWMDNYFATHNDFDVPTKCRQMENHQNDMKKSLKGAVLEQYEYFVQASGEMTTMGREVASLKNYIETQVEVLKGMKEVDFSGCVHNRFVRDKRGDDDYSDVMEPPRLDQPASTSEQKSAEAKKDDRSYLSEVDSYMSFRRGESKSVGGDKPVKSSDVGNESMETSEVPNIHIPEWLDDVTVDIAAMAREGQYTEAIELHTKARNEVVELIDKHERPTSYKLSRKQLHELKKLHKALEQLGKRISERLEETLRRKNEALRQAAKRERADANNAVVTVVSPCALRDDAVFLQLLVKLGRTQVAAEAYSARRSLLLLESLNERPISGAGSVDLVIYSAQLSQSFFSCLAYSVEGFLDLFMSSSPAQDFNSNKAAEDSDSLADSSVHSQSMKTNNAPSGAVSSVVLWCDAELSKFAAAFGGNRVLANLALSPPPRDAGSKKPRVVGEDDANSDRKSAIEVAAQCVDQAFLYATQNLDSVGLPLAPRLAEYIRVRLKGCENEVAQLLDERWQHLTVDWRLSVQQSNGGSFNNRALK
jgi:hypothetical protein